MKEVTFELCLEGLPQAAGTGGGLSQTLGKINGKDPKARKTKHEMTGKGTAQSSMAREQRTGRLVIGEKS